MLTEDQAIKIRGQILIIVSKEDPAENKIDQIMQAISDILAE